MDSGRRDSSGRILWYRNFRVVAYVSTMAMLVWTVLIVLPFAPFSYLPPIIARGGAGVWFLFGYLLYLTIGVAGFGGLSALLYTIEMHENRVISRSMMAIGFTLLTVGMTITCVLLAIVGAVGGYALTILSESEGAAQNLLSPYVYPLTATTLIAAFGAALTILAMAGAKVAKN